MLEFIIDKLSQVGLILFFILLISALLLIIFRNRRPEVLEKHGFELIFKKNKFVYRKGLIEVDLCSVTTLKISDFKRLIKMSEN